MGSKVRLRLTDFRELTAREITGLDCTAWFQSDSTTLKTNLETWRYKKELSIKVLISIRIDWMQRSYLRWFYQYWNFCWRENTALESIILHGSFRDIEHINNFGETAPTHRGLVKTWKYEVKSIMTEIMRQNNNTLLNVMVTIKLWVINKESMYK